MAKSEKPEKTAGTQLQEKPDRREEPEKREEREKHEKRGPKFDRWTVVSLAVFFVAALVFGASFLIFRSAVADAAAAGLDAFNESSARAAQERREEMGALGYEQGFEDFKTVNDVTIRVDEVRKTAKLEVLKVSSVVYIRDTGSLADKVAAWLKVDGEGVYTVDMAAGEYLVDGANRYVLVRVPAPALEKVRVTGYEKKLFRDNAWFPFENAGDGVQLAMNQLALAEDQLTEDIKSTVAANASPEDSARTLIRALVRSLNPEVPDLTVEVEFL